MFGEIYEFARKKLTESGISSVNSELQHIFWYCFGMERADILLRAYEKPDKSEYDNFCKVLEKRCSGVPLQYAIGEWEFMGLRLSVGDGVLIPREDTSVVVNSAIKAIRGIKNPKIIDLCSGSGCIALAVEKILQFQCEIYAVEVSGKAFKYLCENLERNRSKIKAINNNIFNCYKDFDDDFFDLIISNPPYVESETIKDLQAEVLCEPKLALDGGIDGLDFYRNISKCWIPKLKGRGIMAFEIGQGQFETVKDIMQFSGITDIRGFLDINGIVRAVVGKKEKA